MGKTPRWSRRETACVGLIKISEKLLRHRYQFQCSNPKNPKNPKSPDSIISVLKCDFLIFQLNKMLRINFFLSEIDRLSFISYHEIQPSTVYAFIHCTFAELWTPQNRRISKKVRLKMISSESFDYYDLFLIAAICFISIALIHHVLSLSLYPPISGAYRQKAFAFYVKKMLMRLLLRYRKPMPIEDDVADKLQPLSSHPLVSTDSNEKPFYFIFQLPVCEHCRHLTPFISIRALQLAIF